MPFAVAFRDEHPAPLRVSLEHVAVPPNRNQAVRPEFPHGTDTEFLDRVLDAIAQSDFISVSFQVAPPSFP